MLFVFCFFVFFYIESCFNTYCQALVCSSLARPALFRESILVLLKQSIHGLRGSKPQF